MVVSWDYSMIALYHSSSLIQIVAADLSKQISRIQVPGEQSIYRFGWVGMEALFLQRTPLMVQFFSVHDEKALYELHELGESCLINRLIDIGAYGTAAEICKWLRRDEQEGIDHVLLEWVNVLLQLGDIQEALARAAAAQRPQLMHQVVRHLMKEQKRADYELAIRKIPLPSERLNSLRRAKEAAKNLGDKGVEELLSDMAAFAPGQSERGEDHMTIRETVIEHADDAQKVAQFKHQAKLTDKQVWLWTIEGLAKKGKMEQLFDMAQKKSPVGYVPSERLNSLRRAKEAAKNLGDKGVEELLSDMAAFAPGQSERGEDHMTIRETVIEHADDAQKVAQFKHQAKLTDKQVWLWTIEGLAKKGKMEQLFDMAQKKSPVGYVPFIKACMKYNRQDECKKYFAKVHGYQELVAAYMAMGNFVSAAKIAFDRRDRDTLQHVFMKSHANKDAYAKVAQLIKSL
ncbi:Vps16, region [Ancylostoma duodenale]|uniref:Vps16, region n=1 Tax=Ancylostoma duodenale TaxID=51022 RepID=A0A0C2GSI8_9BILA|nr:Vps16, region [Ancylostoma duodenale]